jgi:hypothetical protein
MDDLDVSPEPAMLGKVEIITLALAIQAKGVMPTLEQIAETDLSLGAPRWAKRGHPGWVQHLYDQGLAKNGRITVEGRSSLHWALYKQFLPAPLEKWARKTIGADDV